MGKFHMPTPPGVADMHGAGGESAGQWETDRPDERWVPTHCSFCGVQCGMHLRVAGGRVIGVEPRMDTHNRGKLCPKGVAAYQQLHHPDRLTYPMVRDADGLRRATWDEALDRVVDGIRRIQGGHGKDAVATDRQHLRALARSQRSGRIDHSGVDVAVSKDQVCFRLLSALSARRWDAALRLHSTGRGQQ